MISEKLYSSKSDEWYTPQKLYEELDAEFHFNLDPCATPESAKCEMYYTKEQDGLSQKWGGNRVFCNPPYSEINKWVEKAFRETREDNTLVVMLIPARTDTKYFHNYIYGRSEVRFIKGRVHFSGADSAPFPSMIVIFRGANLKENK